MKSPRIYSRGWFIATPLLGLAIAFVIAVFIEARNVARQSCLASVKRAVQQFVSTNGIALTNLTFGVERLLSPSEAMHLLRLAGNCDCSNYRNADGLPVDPWGRAFYVRVLTNQSGIHAFAFSAGPDGEPGTDDDVR